MDDTKWLRNEDWIGTGVEDSFVMVNVGTGQYVSLNATANAIWSALAEPRTAQDVVDRILSDYVVDDAVCRLSVDEVMKRMRELRIAAPV